MTSLISKTKRLFLTFLISAGVAGAEPLSVDYYGVISSSTDTNMLKMAQDVFFTQLKSIDDISVDDKRPDISKTLSSLPEFENAGKKIAFYAEISEEKSDAGQTQWNCKFNAVTPEDGITHTKNEIFESYYKILVNAKNAIDKVLKDLKPDSPEFKDSDKKNIAEDFNLGIDIESLAGTWTGETFADKIIILRGGRGFVIYKNGATMNVKISVKKINIEGNDFTLEIRQTGKANASFYPELPREKALSAAAAAEPVTWNFSITSPDTLSGIKSTLIESAAGITQGKVSASWNRK